MRSRKSVKLNIKLEDHFAILSLHPNNHIFIEDLSCFCDYQGIGFAEGKADGRCENDGTEYDIGFFEPLWITGEYAWHKISLSVDFEGTKNGKSE